MNEVKKLNEEVNFQGSNDLVIHKGNYPVGNNEDHDKQILTYFGEKIEKHGLPVSVLLGSRDEYQMIECPSYVEFKLLVEEKSMRDGGRFLRQLIEIEEDILIGKTYKGVVDGMKEMNPVDIKGNQILNSMLSKSKKLDRLLARAEKQAESGGDIFAGQETEKLVHIKNILEADWNEVDEEEKKKEGKRLAEERKAKRLARKKKVDEVMDDAE